MPDPEIITLRTSPSVEAVLDVPSCYVCDQKIESLGGFRLHTGAPICVDCVRKYGTPDAVIQGKILSGKTSRETKALIALGHLTEAIGRLSEWLLSSDEVSDDAKEYVQDVVNAVGDEALGVLANVPDHLPKDI